MNEKALEAALDAAYENSDPPDYWPSVEMIRAAITAYLVAMEAEGFVIVPVQPTKAMLAQTSYVTGMNDAPMADWLAMIAARPQTEQEND